MDSNKKPAGPAHYVSWAVAFLLILSALAIVLISLHVSSPLLLAWFLLCMATFFYAERECLAEVLRVTGESASTSILEWLKQLDANPRKDNRASWMLELEIPILTRPIELILVAALSLGAVLLSQGGGKALWPTGPDRSSPELLAEINSLQALLTQCVQNKIQTNPTSVPTLQVSPALENALIGWLNRPSTLRSCSDCSWWPGGIVLFVLIVIAVILLAGVLKEHPAVAPPLGAAGLAAAVIKKVDHFSAFDPSTLDYFFALLVLSAIFVFGVCIFGKKIVGNGPTNPDQHKSLESVTLTAFSVLVLVWVLLLVCFPAPKEKNSAAPEVSQQLTKEEELLPVKGFTSGSHDSFSDSDGNPLDPKSQIDALKRDLDQHRSGKDDFLLLFGSTDCVTYKDGNGKLGQQRASWLQEQLRSLYGANMPPTKVIVLKLHENCKQSSDLRAVFTILVHKAALAK